MCKAIDNRLIYPIFVVDDCGDVEVFTTQDIFVNKFLAAIETIDVENNEYSLFDATGNRYSLILLENDQVKVQMTLSSNSTTEIKEYIYREVKKACPMQRFESKEKNLEKFYQESREFIYKHTFPGRHIMKIKHAIKWCHNLISRDL